MDTELCRLRDDIGSLAAVDGEYATDDNIAIVFVTYFEKRLDRPEDDEIDDEVGWSKWAIEKTNDALNRIVEYLTSHPSGRQKDGAA